MRETKAYSAASATSPVAAHEAIQRRDPGQEHDVEIEISLLRYLPFRSASSA